MGRDKPIASYDFAFCACSSMVADWVRFFEPLEYFCILFDMNNLTNVFGFIFDLQCSSGCVSLHGEDQEGLLLFDSFENLWYVFLPPRQSYCLERAGMIPLGLHFRDFNLDVDQGLLGCSKGPCELHNVCSKGNRGPFASSFTKLCKNSCKPLSAVMIVII